MYLTDHLVYPELLALLVLSGAKQCSANYSCRLEHSHFHAAERIDIPAFG
jgi:hypothetical protein